MHILATEEELWSHFCVRWHNSDNSTPPLLKLWEAEDLFFLPHLPHKPTSIQEKWYLFMKQKYQHAGCYCAASSCRNPYFEQHKLASSLHKMKSSLFTKLHTLALGWDCVQFWRCTLKAGLWGKATGVPQDRIRCPEKLLHTDTSPRQMLNRSFCCIILAILSWKLDRTLCLHQTAVQKGCCCLHMSIRDCFLQWISKRREGWAITKFGTKDCSCCLAMTILQLFVIFPPFFSSPENTPFQITKPFSPNGPFT